MQLVTKRVGLGIIKEEPLDLSQGCTPHCVYFYTNTKCMQCDYDGHVILDWKSPCPRAKFYAQEGENSHE